MEPYSEFINGRSRTIFGVILGICGILCGGISYGNGEKGFRAEQMKSSRVRAVHASKGNKVAKVFHDQGLPYPPRELLIRVFKKERVLELWAGRENQNSMELVKEYPVCANSGVLGPKRRQGDLQVPEGFYYVHHFNPASNYHLSLGVSYPNASDRILGPKGDLGGAIYIHGDCVTIGCIPIENGPMEEVYLAALEAREAGQTRIPVHIFPGRLDDEGFRLLKSQYSENVTLLEFWSNLQEGYRQFEKDRRLFSVSVDKKGRYRFGTSAR